MAAGIEREIQVMRRTHFPKNRFTTSWGAKSIVASVSQNKMDYGDIFGHTKYITLGELEQKLEHDLISKRWQKVFRRFWTWRKDKKKTKSFVSKAFCQHQPFKGDGVPFNGTSSTVPLLNLFFLYLITK